jgi:DNA polymerase elongation subunit (family B)
MRGWILDVYPDYETNTMALWLKAGDRCRKLTYDYEPCFYVHHPSYAELRLLGRSLERTELAKKTDIVEKKTDIQSTKISDVLAVYPPTYGGIRECAHIIDSRGGYYDYRLFNVDVRFSQRFLIERNVFPLALADTSPVLKAHGGQFRVNYRVPNLRTVDLRVKCSGRFPSNHLSIVSITVGDAVLEGAEEDVLADLVEHIKELNPDIIFTENGDSFTLPYLYYRAAVNDLGDDFRLGREKDDVDIAKKARSYFSYGSIVYKPAARKLKGRLHIDRSSFIQEEGGLHALIDLARMSNLPLQTLARLSPGTAISSMQIQQAIRDGYVIEWKKNRPEDFKTADLLLLADRGGFIFDPVVGIHDGIVEVDFISLYPNIMAEFNISPETILCDCCPDSRLRVPELLYNTCEKRVGLIPKVVKPLVQRRLAFKSMIHTRPEMREAFEQRSDLLKWVLVTCFGYTGYKNARFGRIECHESINAYARDIMVKSMKMAEDFGYDVLHGIIDSLWLTPNGNNDHEWVCRYVSRAIGIPLELEGVYKWLVFLPNKGSDTGALNRYYGLFQDGKLKVRGIELRKHDTPVIVRKAQEAMFDMLTTAENSAEFKANIPDAISELRRYYAAVRRRECDIQDMIITKRISRTLEEYSVFNDQVAAMLQLKKQGMIIQPGQKLRFVICDSTTKDPSRRVRVAEMLGNDDIYDAGKYCDLLLRCGESILSPFGYTEEGLRREMPV